MRGLARSRAVRCAAHKWHEGRHECKGKTAKTNVHAHADGS